MGIESIIGAICVGLIMYLSLFMAAYNFNTNSNRGRNSRPSETRKAMTLRGSERWSRRATHDLISSVQFTKRSLLSDNWQSQSGYDESQSGVSTYRKLRFWFLRSYEGKLPEDF